jgi:hypothetical protein
MATRGSNDFQPHRGNQNQDQYYFKKGAQLRLMILKSGSLDVRINRK